MSTRFRPSVYMCGGDNVGWATDDDFFLTRRALSQTASVVESIETAEVVHAVNWRALLSMPHEVLSTRRVVAHVPHDVRAMLSQPDYLRVVPYVTCWVAPSRRAENMLNRLGLAAVYVPYVVDNSVFFPLSSSARQQLRTKLGLPDSTYLIGSFQRDTEGHDLTSPKRVKGPDVFLEIVRKLAASGRAVHVVLAGPRRIWIKRQLAAAGIPYTFIGTERGAADDLRENTLAQPTINELYNAIDLYIVASRLEGGPKAILECAAAGGKIIASEVGQAADILLPAQIFRDLPQAVEFAERDIDSGYLATTIENGLLAAGRQQPESVVPRWREIYAALAQRPSLTTYNFRQLPPPKPPNRWRRLLDKIQGRRVAVDCIRDPEPWYRGDRFLSAVASTLPERGWHVRPASDDGCQVTLGRSALAHSMTLIGAAPHTPEQGIRQHDRPPCITIMPSEACLMEASRLGRHPVNPVIIPYAADPAVFFPRHDRGLPNGRKLRLISTASHGLGCNETGIYEWLDKNLDWQRFEYSVIGCIGEQPNHIQLIEAVDSRTLAGILRQHDIYIAATDRNPVCDALIEAQACGLPTVYLDRGDHRELIGFGGLGFEHPEEIPALLDTIAADYEAFCRLTTPPALATVAQRYAECLDLASGCTPR